MPKSKFFRLLLVLPVSGIGVMLNGCNKPAAGGPPPGAFAVPVTAVTAVTADVPVYLDEIGKATASQSVTILPQVSGPIIKRDFEDGQDLKKGQLLFEIDPRPFQASLDQANGQLAKDTATQTSAAWNVPQDQAAMATKAISEQQLHNDIGTRDAAAGAILVDKAQIYQAQLNLDYCSVKSPIEGRAGLRLVDVGNVVSAPTVGAATSLLSIQTLDPIYADFTITEAELLKVQQYMEHGTLHVAAMLPEDTTIIKGPQPATQPTSLAPGEEFTADPKNPGVQGLPSASQSGIATTQRATTRPAAMPLPRTGKLIFLDNSVQDGSGTVRLRAEIPNADHHFWPGQFLNVRLVLAIKPSVMIPANAAQISQQGLFVYKVSPNANSPTKVIAAMQPITVGQRHGDQVVVETGLSAGDQIVSSGFTLLQPDSPVMVVNAGPPGAGAQPKTDSTDPKAKKTDTHPEAAGPQTSNLTGGNATEGSHS